MAKTQSKDVPQNCVQHLGHLAVACIEYVGYANYRERQRAALNAFDAGYAAALRGDVEAVKAVQVEDFEDD